jgi:hypothetical protein
MAARRVFLSLFLSSAVLIAQDRSFLGTPRTGRALHLQRQVLALPSPQKLQLRKLGSDTLRVLAIMVDFLKDSDPLTTGDGGFQTAGPTSKMIDPPPHDSSYFTFKLQFLSNYFRKVSKGKAQVRGDVLGRVITLSNPMSSYSPPKGTGDNRRLADLVIESWRKADSLYPSIQFSRYDAFALFHAGVGRDIDLVGALGYDPTPSDIPSVTVNLRTLREYLRDPNYTGIPVNNGSFRITNTMILPETETRLIPTGTREDTLHGSINGLLANSFGSVLGLPDLFDTKQGSSGIGGYGLMDVAGGTFFFAGLFPPEPSAWEKVYLGWVTPITVNPGTSVLSLPAVGLTSVGQDTIYKIPINDREYFLIENRSRDPQQNGQRLTVRDGNFTVTRSFPDDMDGFRLDDVSAVGGSVIDVEDFDWALPGYSPDGEEYRGGGVLIWHIDEDVITKGLVDNTVNSNRSRPGVDLEEADGSQDIGRAFEFGTEYGWPLDCWFSGNPSLTYKNIFDRNSYPNSNANSGAQSLITVNNFSVRLPRMTATVQIGDGQFQRIKGFARMLPSGSSTVPPTVTGSTIIACANDGVYAFQPDGSSKTQDETGLFWPKGGQFSIAALDLGSGNRVLAGAQDSSLYIWTIGDRNADGLIDTVQTVVVPLGEGISTPPMFADVFITRSIVVVGNRGSTWQVDLNGTVQRKGTISSQEVTSIAQLPTPSLSRPSEVFYVTRDRLFSDQTSVPLGDSSRPWLVAGAVARLSNFVVAAQQGGTKVVVYDRALANKLSEYIVAEGAISSLAVADLDADGNGDVIVLAGRCLYAFNRAGAVLGGFPIAASNDNIFVGVPLIADISGDGFADVVVLDSSGELTGYDRSGRRLDGFPLQFTSTGETISGLFRTLDGKIGFVGVSRSGAVQALELNAPFKTEGIAWSQHLADARHVNFGGSTTVVVAPPSELLPHSRVYNWPNPVYGSATQIRYYTPEDADITVKIFDLTGAALTELRSRSVGGLDGEITWDVTDIQSGVYLARVEAVSGSRSEVAIIKIAIVK